MTASDIELFPYSFSKNPIILFPRSWKLHIFLTMRYLLVVPPIRILAGTHLSFLLLYLHQIVLVLIYKGNKYIPKINFYTNDVP